MSKRAKLAAAIGAALLAVYLLRALLAAREPAYNGLTMKDWFDRFDDPHRDEALLILGTNNLDLLVQRLTYDPRKDWVCSTINKVPYKWQKKLRLDGIVLRRTYLDCEAFQLLSRLETNAAPAIPKLAALAEAGGPPSTAALNLLSGIGPDGLVIVASKTAHTNLAVRLTAVCVLAGQRDSLVALRALTNALADPDFHVRERAWLALTNDALALTNDSQ